MGCGNSEKCNRTRRFRLIDMHEILGGGLDSQSGCGSTVVRWNQREPVEQITTQDVMATSRMFYGIDVGDVKEINMMTIKSNQIKVFSGSDFYGFWCTLDQYRLRSLKIEKEFVIIVYVVNEGVYANYLSRYSLLDQVTNL